MRFYLVLFFCVSLLFTSCKDDKGIPGDVIPEHEMALLLMDIHIVDGSLYDVPQTPDSLTKHGLALYMGLFKAYRVDTVLFKKSLKFYSTRPDLLNEIYTGVNMRLQKKIDSLQKIKPKINVDSVNKVNLKHKTDSLKKAKEQHKTDSVKKVKALIKLDSLQKVKSGNKSKKIKHKKPHALSQ